MSPFRPKIEQEYDVFVKEPAKGWCFKERIKASSLKNAKEVFLKENTYTPEHAVTVYPRR